MPNAHRCVDFFHSGTLKLKFDVDIIGEVEVEVEGARYSTSDKVSLCV
jgi:hypothetical protein